MTKAIYPPNDRRGAREKRAACAALLLGLMVTVPAAAAPKRLTHEDETNEHEHAAEAANAFTLKLAALEVIYPEGEPEEMTSGAEMGLHGAEVVSHVGVSLSFERVLVPGWLAAEINAMLSPTAEGPTVPVELFLKKPFELSPIVEPFIGVGLATEWLEAGQYRPQYGFASVLGSYFWLESKVGLVLETEYSLFTSREVEHELVLAAGGALRF